MDADAGFHLCIGHLLRISRKRLLSRLLQSVHIDPAVVSRHKYLTVRDDGWTELAVGELIVRDMRAVPEQLQTRTPIGIRYLVEGHRVVGAENAFHGVFVRIAEPRGRCPNDPSVCLRAVAR